MDYHHKPAEYPEHEKTDLLRLVTMGSVDDGKSTLIGRLLLDTQALPDDQVEAIEQVSHRQGDDFFDLALITDGLKAEREQGITIDVAFRYFSSPNRRYILADCPGHIQYTRNLVTGASTADVALIMVDARKGITEQTRRHLYIAGLLRLKKVVLCINKMDLVEYKEEVFLKIKSEAEVLLSRAGITNWQCIPVSALQGDNVVFYADLMPWYKGKPLFELLETLSLPADNFNAFRFPVQTVIKTHQADGSTFRGYAGAVANGTVKPGQKVLVLPSGLQTTVATISTFDGDLDAAAYPQSVTLTLADELDISRGDMIVELDDLPFITQELEAMVCWMDTKPLHPGDRLLLKHTTSQTKCVVKEIEFRVNLEDLQPDNSATNLIFNDIGRVRLKLANSICYDPYKICRITGSFILIDELTNQTVAGGMIG